VFTVTPPMSMLARLIGLMGLHRPASAMGQLTAAVHSGQISPAMLRSLASSGRDAPG
jgi:hypothetical protein